MPPKIRLWILGFLLVIFPGVMVGYGYTAPAALGTLIVAMPGTVDHIDPTAGTGPSFTSQTVMVNIYDQLTDFETRMSPDGYLVDNTEKIVGMAAKSFEMPLGSKRIVYRVRDGVKFHDGTPVDAEALKFTFDRIIATKLMAFGFVDQAGARTKESFRVVDNKTVAVDLERPNPIAPKLLSLLNIVLVNPKLVQEHATANDPDARNWVAVNDAGSGPFVLRKLEPTNEVILERFNDYWKGPAKLQRVIMKVVPNASARVLALQRGAVDMITEVPPKDIASLERNAAIKILSLPSRKFHVLGMNVSVPPLNNAKVRQALCYAVPYDTIIQESFRGRAQRMRSAIAKGTPTHTEKFGYDTNLDKAKSLLTEAGVGGFRATLSVRTGFEEDEEAAVWIKSSLARIGVNVDIEKLPVGGFVTKGRAKGFQLYLNSHAFWVNDPYYAYYFLHQTGAGSSYTGYSNLEVDRLLRDNMASGNLATRAGSSERMQQVLMEEAPFCYLAQANVNVAMRKNVEGYRFAFDATHVVRFYTMHKVP